MFRGDVCQRLCKQNCWIRMCQQGRTVSAKKDQMDIHKYELLLVIHVTNRAYASSHGTRDSLRVLQRTQKNMKVKRGQINRAINYTQARNYVPKRICLHEKGTAWKNRRTRHDCTQQRMKQLSSVCVPIEQITENTVVTTRWADWKASKPCFILFSKGHVETRWPQ